MPTLAGTNIASNTVHTAVTNILNASEDLANEYRRLDGIISDFREEQTHPIAETWKQDLEEADKQLRLGARVAMRNMRKLLGAEDGSTPEPMHEDGDVNLEGDEVQLNYEFLKSLKYAERGVKRMTKGLPLDEGS